jgi:ABC-type Zn uptake system ZnuABC Zn-binding protein ZnuA
MHRFSIALLLAFTSLVSSAEPIRVCASVPDLASLAQAVGGDLVTVTTFAHGADDPHFVEPRPSFISALARADALLEIGLELEIGWLPPVVHQAGNARLQVGQPGRIVAASAISPIGIPSGAVDRSQGDVHALGNPHFLIDPVCGAQVARLIRDRFSILRPDAAETFAANEMAFEQRLVEALIGTEAAKTLGPSTAIDLAIAGNLEQAAVDQHCTIGGWQAALATKPPQPPLSIVCDHDLWPYFARRFGITVVGFLEPKPGIAPTGRHLGELSSEMARLGIRVIVSSPYFDPKPAQRLAKANGASVVVLAHQVGAIEGTNDYIDCINYDVTTLAKARNALP